MHRRITRRRMSLTLGILGCASASAQSKKPGTTIHHEIDYKILPERIYKALLDPKQFAAFSGDTAEIEPTPGGVFKLFGGRIEGRNIELLPNQRIVQAWRPAS